MHELGRELRKRCKDEAPFEKARVRYRQRFRTQDHIPQEQNVHIQNARPVFRPDSASSSPGLDGVANVQQRLGITAKTDVYDRVDEPIPTGCVDGLGVVERRAAQDLDTSSPELTSASRSSTTGSPRFDPSPR